MFSNMAREDADGLFADYRASHGEWQGDLKVILVADLSPSICLETEAAVPVARPKAELLDVIQSGKRARIN